MILDIPVGRLHVGREVYNVISRSRGGLSWAVVLPGQWGADDARQRLETMGALLPVDASLSEGCSTGALREALRAEGALACEDPASGEGGKPSRAQVQQALMEWARQASEHIQDSALPMVFIDHPELLDVVSVEILEDLLAAGCLRIGAVVPTTEALPGYLVRQWRVGNLQLLRAPLVTFRDLDRAVRRRLAGSVSQSVLQRMTVLCGRHAWLADKVLDVAKSSGVLHYDGYTWRWGAEESQFLDELALLAAPLLSRFSDAERELLILTAVCGSIPAEWAAQRYGEDTVRSLAAQRLIGSEPAAPRGFLDLRITAEAVRSMVLAGVSEIEKGRLWHMEGRRMPPTAGGSASQAARIHWRAITEGRIAASDAYDAARCAVTRGWYQNVLDLAERLQEPCARVQLLAARSHLALGDAAAALDRIRAYVVVPAQTGDGVELQVLRRAAVLAERIALFHPRLAAPVIAQLRGLSDAPLTPHLDELKAGLPENSDPTHAQALSLARARCYDEECILGRLWLGAHLGLRRYPDMGRLVLASLLDDLIREGGYPDVEESVVALLLLITSIHGWRTDVLKLEMHLRREGVSRGPALPAVTDVIASVSAMQRDRMLVAYQCAALATRVFAETDPFGLHAFASSLAVAAASYVDEDLGVQEHERHWSLYGQGLVDYGPEPLRLTTEGMALVGSGWSREKIGTRLVQLSHVARRQGEWAQQQQLLLLAVLGGSTEAAEAVLDAPWKQESGRPGMIGMLARALSVSTPEEAVDTAELLIDAEATFFGLTILIHLWGRRGDLVRGLRTRIIHTIRNVRRRDGEESWLLRNGVNFQLDEREAATLRLLEAGTSSRNIALELHLSQRTVETTISGLCHRFACANRVELLALGLLED